MTSYTGARYAAKVTCDTCGCLLPASQRDLHTAWHASLAGLLQPDATGPTD